MRSFFVVSAFMIGGWMTGTSAMYEYAATAIGPNSSGASFEVTKMAVGPSAPPMMPMELACSGVKPSRTAPMYVMKMPSCAAAPSSRLFGLAISGPKSVMQPTPTKIRHGYTPSLTPR